VHLGFVKSELKMMHTPSSVIRMNITVDSKSEVWFAFLTDVTLFELNQSSIKPRVYIAPESSAQWIRELGCFGMQ
jgi:streptogramin lyase